MRYKSDLISNNKTKCWMRQIVLTALQLFCVFEGIYFCVSRVTVRWCTGTNFCTFPKKSHEFIQWNLNLWHKKCSFSAITEIVSLDNYFRMYSMLIHTQLLPYVQHAYTYTHIECMIFTHLQKIVEMVCKGDPKFIAWEELVFNVTMNIIS